MSCRLRCSGVIRRWDRRWRGVWCPGRGAVDDGGEGIIAEPAASVDHDGLAFGAKDDGAPFEEGAEGGDVEGADLALAGKQDDPIADEAGGELVSTACAADTWFCRA